MSATSNAAALASAVSAVAAEVERTGIEVAHISADRDYGLGYGVTVKVQAIAAEDVAHLASVFPGIPGEARLYGPGLSSSMHRGEWVGMGFRVEVFGPAPAVKA